MTFLPHAHPQHNKTNKPHLPTPTPLKLFLETLTDAIHPNNQNTCMRVRSTTEARRTSYRRSRTGGQMCGRSQITSRLANVRPKCIAWRKTTKKTRHDVPTSQTGKITKKAHWRRAYVYMYMHNPTRYAQVEYGMCRMRTRWWIHSTWGMWRTIYQDEKTGAVLACVATTASGTCEPRVCRVSFGVLLAWYVLDEVER